MTLPARNGSARAVGDTGEGRRATCLPPAGLPPRGVGSRGRGKESCSHRLGRGETLGAGRGPLGPGKKEVVDLGKRKRAASRSVWAGAGTLERGLHLEPSPWAGEGGIAFASFPGLFPASTTDAV